MATEKELEERLTNLEVRYAFQEQVIEQLNGEIMRQQNEIDDLAKRLKEILLQSNAGLVEKEVEKPPHY